MLAIKKQLLGQKFYTYSGAALLMLLVATTAIRLQPGLGQFIADAPAKTGNSSVASTKHTTTHQENTKSGEEHSDKQQSSSSAGSGGTTTKDGKAVSPKQNVALPSSSPSGTFVAPLSQSAPAVSSSPVSVPTPVTGGNVTQPAPTQSSSRSKPSGGSGNSAPLLNISIPLLNTSLSLL